MARKTISAILVVAHMIMIVGCTATRSEKVEVNEIREGEIIESAVLNDGEVVNFDSKGGKYQTKVPDITGTAEDGKLWNLPLRDIYGLRTERPDTVDRRNLAVQQIREILLWDGGLMQFDSSGGSYDPAMKSVLGKWKDKGTQIKVEISRIKEFRTTSPEILLHLPPGVGEAAEVFVRPGGRVLTFDKNRGKIDTSEVTVIAGETEAGVQVQLSLGQVLYVKVQKADPAGTVVKTIGGLVLAGAAVVAVIAILKQSCPFVYSYDGNRFVFDAEPLGGAISRGLSKTDYSRLEHLRPAEGHYQLLLKNEVEETQYLNELKLLVVDHREGTEVIPTSDGKFHVVSDPKSLIRAIDEDGKDLRKFVGTKDEIEWQTKLPKDSTQLTAGTRHTLTFEFVKPTEAKTGRLIVRAGTSLWGSNMIREMLSLRGNRVDDWYSGIDLGGPEAAEMLAFMAREELYWLNVYAKAKGTWIHVGYIPGGGPLVHEDRSIVLDLSRVEGDTLAIQLRPPRGFWAIDYVGFDFGAEMIASITELVPVSAMDHDGKDVTADFSSRDDRLHTMPRVGDWTKVRFEVPDQSQAMRRSIFLKTAGYYTLHLDKTQPEQTALLSELQQTPGLIVQYALKKYLEWQATFPAQQKRGGVQ